MELCVLKCGPSDSLQLAMVGDEVSFECGPNVILYWLVKPISNCYFEVAILLNNV